MNSSSQKKTNSVIEPELLLAAYAAGYFPMADSRSGPVQWYSPDPRAILPLDSFNISRSLRQIVKKQIFQIRINTAFDEVIRFCAGRKETWISEDIIQSYLLLHQVGYAHSVEAWSGGALAGGLYGVALGAAFFGESMFSRKRDASKVALVSLVDRLKKQNFELLDTQFITPHLVHFGAIEIPREAYLKLLKKAIQKKQKFSD